MINFTTEWWEKKETEEIGRTGAMDYYFKLSKGL
jgi:hypothetical protein